MLDIGMTLYMLKEIYGTELPALVNVSASGRVVRYMLVLIIYGQIKGVGYYMLLNKKA